MFLNVPDVVMKINLIFPTLLIAISVIGCSEKKPSEPPVVQLTPAADVIREALLREDATTIHIDQLPVTDDDLSALQGNLTITNLLLDESEVTDEGIAVIASMPNLIHLRVRSNLTDACIDHILKLEKLQFLNLPYADFTDEGMQQLATHPRIQLLRLRSPKLTDACMPAIASMNNLAFLHLIEIPITDKGLVALHDNSALQSLYLDDSQATQAGLSKLIERQPMLHLHINQAHLDNDPRKDDHEH